MDSEEKRVPLSGKPAVSDPSAPAPDMSVDANGMHPDYWILSDAERAMGFLRPVRTSYIHETCRAKTIMNRRIAETYARDPQFYGSTFCVACGGHFPVGKDGQFLWDGTAEKVGT